MSPENPKNLPVPWPGGPDREIEFHRHEWESGTRAHLRVPADFCWPSNPKEHQEENGSGEAEKPISK